MRLGSGACIAIVIWLALAVSQPAFAERRVALVIGNSNYSNVVRLPNPRNDAGDVTASLKTLGFDVTPGLDLDRNGLLNALVAFGRAAEGADVALFFYAGHGLQVNGQNYLVPVDARVEYEAELDLALVPVPLVMQQLARGSRVNIVMLDACRDNPFAKELSRTLGTRSASSLGRGLSRIQSASGTFLAFATQPDNVAQDGDGRNSPFTRALLANMAKPGLSLSDMMIEVRNDVMQQTNGKQVPWDSSSLTGRFSFKVEGTVTVTRERSSEPSDSAADVRLVERGAWNAIQDSGDPSVFERFLRDYPDGLYAPLARDRLAKLTPEKKPAPQVALAPSVPPVASPHAIIVPATSVNMKRSHHVEVGGGLAAAYGPDVIHNAPPYTLSANAAEWTFAAPAAGPYQLDIEFAALERRPVKIVINGVTVRADGLNETTGGWTAEYQQFRPQGRYGLRAGENRIRLETASVFPHIRTLRFTP